MYQLRRSENVPPSATIFLDHLHSCIAIWGLKRNALRFRDVRWYVFECFGYVRQQFRHLDKCFPAP